MKDSYQCSFQITGSDDPFIMNDVDFDDNIVCEHSAYKRVKPTIWSLKNTAKSSMTNSVFLRRNFILSLMKYGNVVKRIWKSMACTRIK